MAELRLMTKDDIKKCTEIYMSAFPKEGKLTERFRDWLPEYYEKYIGSEEAPDVIKRVVAEGILESSPRALPMFIFYHDFFALVKATRVL